MKHTYLFAALLLFSGLQAQEKFSVYFDTDVDVPNAESSAKLEKWIAENKDADLQEIVAYADSIGKPDYNFELSKRRLVYVTKHVISSGIIPKQMKSRAWGEEQSGTGTLADNRRVDVFYIKPKPKPKPEPVKELEQAVTVAKKGEKLKLKGLNFYNNSDVVLPVSEPVLRELLSIMNKNENLKIEIQGHVCCHKQEINNVSINRAKAVYNYLLKNGIDKGRLSYKGMAGSQPVYAIPEKSEDEMVANRRVEIQIVEN